MRYQCFAIYCSRTHVVCMLCLLCCGALNSQSARAGEPHTATLDVLILPGASQEPTQTDNDEGTLARYEQELAAALEHMDKIGANKALLNLCRICQNIGQSDRVEVALQRARNEFNAGTDDNQIAEALRNIGLTYSKINQKDKALMCWQKALEYIGEDKSREAWLRYYIACAYSDTGETQKALESFQRARKLAHANGNTEYEAEAFVGIGRIYLDLGEPKDALEAIQSALLLLKGMTDQNGLAVAFNSIGQFYYDVNQPEDARQNWEKALSLFRAAGNRKGEASVQVNMGNIYSRSDTPEKALKYYEDTLKIAQAIPDESLEAKALTNIGSINADMKRFENAWKYWQDALHLLDSIGDTRGEAIVLDNIGRVSSFFKGALDQAQKQYQQALALAHDAGDRITEINILTDIAEFERQRDHFTEANSYYDQALQLVEKLRTSLGGYTEAKSRYLQSQLPLYYAAIDVALHRHDDERAFNLAQKTKARNLLDLMAYGRVDLSHDLTPGERQQEQWLCDQADLLNRRMVKEGVENEIGAKHRYAALKDQLIQTETDIRVFTNQLYANHPTLANKRAATTAGLTDMAQLLPEDTALLEYVIISPKKVALFVVRQSGGKPTVQAFQLHLEYDSLAKEIAGFRDLCTRPKTEYQEAATKLYAELLVPARQAFEGATRLVICPDQALSDMPFAALLLTDGKTFLADRYEIAYAYSATGLQAARTLRQDPGRTQPTKTLLAVGDPDFGVNRFGATKFGDQKDVPGQRPFDMPSRPFNMPSRPLDMPSRPLDMPSRNIEALLRGKSIPLLPGTKDEADALGKLFFDATVYTGAAAQESQIKAIAGNYRYLHFATHGFFNDVQPMLSSIVLAQPAPGSKDDGFLTARELSELNLSAEMVVLSACNTARGEDRSGEGVIGLSWALLVAGAPTQVVSQWSVDDAATATLMKQFYTNLKAGQEKGAALRAACKALRNDGNIEHRHPYYWAPFLLLGDWK